MKKYIFYLRHELLTHQTKVLFLNSGHVGSCCSLYLQSDVSLSTDHLQARNNQGWYQTCWKHCTSWFGQNTDLPDCMHRKQFQIFWDMGTILLLPVWQRYNDIVSFKTFQVYLPSQNSPYIFKWREVKSTNYQSGMYFKALNRPSN